MMDPIHECIVQRYYTKGLICPRALRYMVVPLPPTSQMKRKPLLRCKRVRNDIRPWTKKSIAIQPFIFALPNR